jgi:hypothetical protein
VREIFRTHLYLKSVKGVCEPSVSSGTCLRGLEIGEGPIKSKSSVLRSLNLRTAVSNTLSLSLFAAVDMSASPFDVDGTVSVGPTDSESLVTGVEDQRALRPPVMM